MTVQLLYFTMPCHEATLKHATDRKEVIEILNDS